MLVKHGDLEEEIDVLIAPLILEMWKAGIETLMSCQSAFKKVWIQFPDVSEVEKFLNIAGGDFDHHRRGSLYDRLSDQWFVKNQRFYNARCWEYEVGIIDFGKDQQEDCPFFSLYINVRFPKRDLPAVLERMQRYNAAS
ncbi:MAG: hypothetical protein M3348_17590 [Acidobacteriota bacterium]|nr:hypothetical protein [Acidobacteriota bacterium]